RTTDRGLPTCWRTRDLAGDRERLAERRGLLGERRPTQRRARRTPRRTDRGTGLTAALVPESSVPLVHWATRSPPVYPRLPTGEQDLRTTSSRVDELQDPFSVTCNF